MHVHRNNALLKLRLQLSIVFFVASLTCLLGGFVVSTRLQDLGSQYAVSLSTLGFGIALWWQNKVYLARWGPRSQQDAALARALRGLDGRHHLFAFASAQLPDYILAGPEGVIVLVPRAVKGTVSCTDGRWRHDEAGSALLRLSLIMSPRPTLGNPSRDVSRSVADVQRFLSSRLGAENNTVLPVEGVLVLMEPGVKLATQGCTTQAMYLRSLRSHVRRAPRALSVAELDKVIAALEAA